MKFLKTLTHKKLFVLVVKIAGLSIILQGVTMACVNYANPTTAALNSVLLGYICLSTELPKEESA